MPKKQPVCPRCGSTEKATNRACLPCKNKKDKERKRRKRARTDWTEHVPDVPAEPAPPGYHIQRVSQLTDGDGNTRLTWRISEPDKDAAIQAMRAAFEDLAESVTPAAPIVPPEQNLEDLLAVYPWGDPHIGMLSWKDETGHDFDLKIAERLMALGVDDLVSKVPPARYAVLLNLGDYFHADNPSNRTPRSGNQLDVDGRYGKVLRVGVNIMCRAIERMLQKHEIIEVRNNGGNHDPVVVFALSMILEQRYRDEPRVKIDTSLKKHWYRSHGEVLIGSTHGDTKRSAADLHGIMSVDVERELWAKSSYRRWYLGHVHNETVKEHYGTVVETFRTLAPGDAWHVGYGYRAGRDMRCDIWDRRMGYGGRIVSNPIAIERAA